MPSYRSGCQHWQHARRIGVPAYLGVHILQIRQPVGAVFRVPDVVVCHLLIAAGGQEDAVHKVSDSSRVVCLVFVVPLGRDLV